ncbi:MAG: LLM class flavin-dependent oxidoreductase [Spirulina sp.]
MKAGLFCTYENNYQDSHRAIVEQTALIQHAEALQFEEAWIAEHHFNSSYVNPSILLLMAYLAGITSRIQIGSAAILLAFHDPVKMAEEIATLDHLCNGRFLLGVAKGGPFPDQNKHFGVAMDEARPRMIEALKLVEKLLYSSNVTFSGKYYHCNSLTVQPQPLQDKIPVYIATSDRDAIELAALYSYGLMGGAPFSISRLKMNQAQYHAINSSGSDKLVLTRFFFVAQTDEEAIQESLPFIQSFAERMKKNISHIKNDGNTQHLKPSSQQKTCFDEAYLLENSIIGSTATCRDKIKRFRDDLNIGTLALKPCSFNLHKNIRSLTEYAEHLRDLS